jgi:hypothetical protein
MRLATRLEWFIAAVIGYALGMAASVAIVGAIARPLSPALGGLVYVALFGAIVGVGVAFPQFFVLPRGAVSPGAWIAITALGAAAGFALASFVGEILGNVIPYTVGLILGGGSIQGVSGAMVGLGIACAQRLVVPTLGRRWIVATVVGVGLGYAAAAGALEFVEVAVLKANLPASFGAIIGIFVGIVQLLVIRPPRRSA